MLSPFEAQISEYEKRMGAIAETQGLELLMCHTVMDRVTGDTLSWSHNTISDRPASALAYMMQGAQLYNSLSS